MQKYTEYQGTFRVKIFLNEEALTERFYREFSEDIFPIEDADDVRHHLAQLWCRGMVDNGTEALEGFGQLKDFGIRFEPSSSLDASPDIEVA